MNKIKHSITFTAILLLFSGGVFSQTLPSKTEKIKTLLELTGSANLGIQMIDQIISSFSSGSSKIPESFWDTFRKEISSDGLLNRIIPIYEKHYTEEDIDGLIKFYQSDLGKKVTASLPVVMQESMQAGQEWGREIAEKAINKLKEQGLEK